MERVSAKVLGRSAASSSALETGESILAGCAGAAAGGALEKGFAAPGDGLANGFAPDNMVEKGFACGVDPAAGFTPKRASPSPVGGGTATDRAGLSSLTSFCFGAGGASVVTLTPRRARILPSFLRQVFRLHEKTYNRRSWLGNRSGSSPFSWSSRTMRSLQALHFANAADGGFVGFSHSGRPPRRLIVSSLGSSEE